MIDQTYLNTVPYYRIKIRDLEANYKYSVDAEVSKFKRSTFTSLESILRQTKLLQSIRSSGEDEKLIELIDKWETAIKESIVELYNHQTGDRSMKKFVKKLGLNWEDLGFSEDENLSETESESEREISNDENSEHFGFGYKKIKYED